MLPEQGERRREILRSLLHPAREVSGGEPISCFEFLRIKLERAFVLIAIDPDVFLARFQAGGNLEKPGGGTSQFQAQFLAQFPHGTSVIALADLQMPGSRRVPLSWKGIFFHGPLLEKNLATTIEN